MQESVGATIERAQEALEGFKTFRGLGAEATALARFDQASEKGLRPVAAARAAVAALPPAAGGAVRLSVVAVLWIGGEAVIAGTLEIGEVVAGLGLALLLVFPVQAAGEWAVSAQTALASAGRIAELLDAVVAPRAVAAVPPSGRRPRSSCRRSPSVTAPGRSSTASRCGCGRATSRSCTVPSAPARARCCG